jgi:hypothetical protein
MAWGTALGLAFASDTLFMATMELVDNTIMLVDHEKANKLMLFNDNGKTCATSSCSNHWPSATLNQRAVGYAPAGPCRFNCLDSPPVLVLSRSIKIGHNTICASRVSRVLTSERCMSGSARGRAKPLAERPEWRACPTQPYIPMHRGFVYLCAVMDWASRRLLAWQLSNTLTTDFCTEAVQEAVTNYGPPTIFNTDQGCQFTSLEFTGILKAHGIQISMDGTGC